ncbi:MAG: ABC transporter permease [Planctomycetota bacterium]
MLQLAAGSALVGAVSTWLRPLGDVAIWATVTAALLLGIVVLLRFAVPRISAVASTTSKEILYQPLFYVLLAIGVFALLLFPFIPYYTFGDDVKMFKDSSLTLIMLLSVILAVWSGSVSVAEEIEGRVALTVLAKPIRRVEFILGKFLGILFPVALMFLILGTLFLCSVSFKVVYDAKEMAYPEPTWHECAYEIRQIAPGLLLAFMEATVLASISLAISTRLPMVPNLIICAAIYALGHLLPTLVDSTAGKFEIAQFFAQLLATVLPMLEHFNIYTAIALGREVPLTYVLTAAAYCVLFTTVALLFALLLFEDRDLA